jgi:hypothetical protein
MFLRGRVTTAASVTGTGTPATNNATFTAHGINRNGFRVRFTSVGTLTGVVINTDYYAIVVDSNTLAFAATLANATAATPTRITLGGTNNAVIAQWEDPDASSRSVFATGANGGMSAGSFQADDFALHTHTAEIPSASYSNALAAAANGVGGANLNGTQVSNVLGNTGGNETRPKNISINYIIKT